MPTRRGSVVGPIRRRCRPRPGSTSPRINPNKLNTRVPLDLTDTGPPHPGSLETGDAHGAGHHPAADAEGLSDAAWAVFQELRPQFDGLLPAGLVRDYVN